MQYTPEEYMADRVEDQIEWYDKKSQGAQRWFKGLRIIEIFAAAAIPIFAGFGGGAPASIWIIGILGALITILTSAMSLYQFQEKWIEYRTTCESLKHEKFIYLARAEPYNEGDPFELFVQRVESLISKENSSWSQYTKSCADASKPKQGVSTNG